MRIGDADFERQRLAYYATSDEPGLQDIAREWGDEVICMMLARNPHITGDCATALTRHRSPQLREWLAQNPALAHQKALLLLAHDTHSKVLTYVAWRPDSSDLHAALLANPHADVFTHAGLAASHNPDTLLALPQPWHPYVALRLASNPYTPPQLQAALTTHRQPAVRAAVQRTQLGNRTRWWKRIGRNRKTSVYASRVLGGYMQMKAWNQITNLDHFKLVSVADWMRCLPPDELETTQELSLSVMDWLVTHPETCVRERVPKTSSYSDHCLLLEHDPDPGVATQARTVRMRRLRSYADTLDGPVRSHALLLVDQGFPGDVGDLNTIVGCDRAGGAR